MRIDPFKKLKTVQKKAVKYALRDLKKVKTSLIRMPTGTGKTEVMISIYKQLPKNTKKVLILAHQINLIEQLKHRFEIRLGSSVKITRYDGIEKNISGNIVIANPMTMGKMNILKHEFKNVHFDYIFADECHHAASGTWTRIFNKFNKAKKLVVSATPYRADGKFIEDVFGLKKSYNLTFKDAQKQGLVAKDNSRVVLTNSKLNGAVDYKGEYTAKTLEKLWFSEGRAKIIVKAYKKYGKNLVIKAKMKPKALCFCINSEHAKYMSDTFKKAGIVSEYLISDINQIDKEQRILIEKKFKETNKIEVLCVVGLFGEGTDVPDANIMLLARPTRSSVIYEQQVGRGARIDAGKKKFFVVLDFVDNSRKEFIPYTMSNMLDRKLAKNRIVREYLSVKQFKDNKELDERISNIMSSAEKFELDVNKRYKIITEENLKYMVKTGKIDERIYV